MANDENLIPLNQRTKSVQREIQAKGGKASAQARKKKRDARQTLELINSLGVGEANRDKMLALRIPKDAINQQTLRLLGLNKRACEGDVAANRLILEVLGQLRPMVREDKDDVGFAFVVQDLSGDERDES